MIEELRAVIMADKVPYIEGPPGWGKTTIAKILGQKLADQFGLEQKIHVVIVFLAQRAGNETHGIPVLSKQQMKFGDRLYSVVEQAPPDYAVSIASSPNDYWLIMFDELNQLSPTDAGQAMSILTERLVGGVPLARDRVGLIAAGNPVELSAGGWTLPPPLRRRVVVLPMQVSTQEFSASHAFPDNWGYPLPPVVKYGQTLDMATRRRRRLQVAAWAAKSPDLFDVPKDVSSWSRGFACPATLEDAADLLASCDQFVSSSVSEEKLAGIKSTVLSGAIGPGNALSLLEFIKAADVPDAEVVLNNLDRCSSDGTFDKFEERPDLMYYFLLVMLEDLRYRHRLVKQSMKVKADKQKEIKDYHRLWELSFHLVHRLVKRARVSHDILAMVCGTLVRPDLRHELAKAPAVLAELSAILDIAKIAGIGSADAVTL